MLGLRRALALLILAFYTFYFALTALLGPDELYALNLGLTLCYGLAFTAAAAEWFWGRWFAMGVGNFGSLMLLVLFKVGFEPVFVFFGVSHLLVVLALMGEGMAAKYEYSEQTAERWNFQEESIALMRRAVKSAGSTVPLLIIYALAPRPEPEVLQFAVLAATVAGFLGLIRGKTWGPLVLGGVGALCLADGLGLFGKPTMGFLLLGVDSAPMLYGNAGVFAGSMLLVLVPFLVPMVRYLRARG